MDMCKHMKTYMHTTDVYKNAQLLYPKMKRDKYFLTAGTYALHC